MLQITCNSFHGFLKIENVRGCIFRVYWTDYSDFLEVKILNVKAVYYRHFVW